MEKYTQSNAWKQQNGEFLLQAIKYFWRSQYCTVFESKKAIRKYK